MDGTSVWPCERRSSCHPPQGPPTGCRDTALRGVFAGKVSRWVGITPSIASLNEKRWMNRCVIPLAPPHERRSK